MVGAAMGARVRSALRRAAIVTSQWGVGFALAMGLAMMLAGPALIDVMTVSPEVRAVAREYLPWMIALPPLGIAAWMFDGIFIGATRTRELRNAMLVSVTVYGVALAVLLPAFGNHGLWASLMVLNVMRGVTLALRYPALEASAAA
jgi:MATE family multidrug resistance protein